MDPPKENLVLCRGNRTHSTRLEPLNPVLDPNAVSQSRERESAAISRPVAPASAGTNSGDALRSEIEAQTGNNTAHTVSRIVTAPPVESEVRFDEHTPVREAFTETSNSRGGKRSISLESSTGHSYHQSSPCIPEKWVSAGPFMRHNDMDSEGRSQQ
ncbi:hypothetical protein BWQ96_01020 [Gracilariopsis chorda]|uniref:Uncharacterized protein n=1 Tax=Gracilariopsis chorda TaxID=448386 RepID=A0A2V3J451_9FLOR|nr:hypothetical protein BWQ96_01020 [Gracilariopsis chorda]|eukprot:PXF49231.1 hypothetical protein BWQ96_01020 [Gracilariopsis chorda]